ncbi:hypothetical protein [Paenibacillus sp. GYB003]|uniref:hypothetical protein n=1 Tax=Paenibacillus sp. GYB003 TaxID=2994392 RepID=UPI002F96CFE0
MKRIDAEFEAELDRELSSAPLKRRGFTDELRKRIEERADMQTKCARPWLHVAGSFLSVSVVIAAFAAFLFVGDEASKTALPEEKLEPANQLAQPLAFADEGDQQSFTSGLLIGLRTDDKETSYRTLYIAPRKERPALVAQGSGILVPYKRDFWKIEPLHYETVTDRYEFFVSHPAAQRAAEARTIGPGLFKDNPNEKVIHAEKILFAANEYVSIGETSEVLAGNGSSAKTRAWTTTIPNLAAKRRPVTLNEALGTKLLPSEYGSSDWFVARSEGRWVAMAAEAGAVRAAPAAGLEESYRRLDVQLPKSVINHDEPCCTWSDIGTRFPGATDTFSSPDKDMTVVSTDGLLLVFGSPGRLTGEPALTIKLKSKETVVMAQWATDHYVEEWAQKTAELLR